MGRLLKTLPSLIVGGLINRGLEVHLTLVIWGGCNKLKWVDICATSLNWGVSNRLGDQVMSLIAKIKQTMHKLRMSLKAQIGLKLTKMVDSCLLGVT